ncbi:type IV pilin protein [Vibrio zhugei]|uniref:Type IV pilin protein n=1 Tax=Vibrio zhugei TaxID=2479546 RepID=A0ABV7C9P7_9VIBR|nr:type IV pilin protein [Vibrio zhugei]
MHRNIKRQRAYHHRHGMTLIEILIVLSIIALLSALAYPTYQEHVLSSHRRQALLDMARIQLYIDGHASVSQAIASITEQGQCTKFCNTPSSQYIIHITAHPSSYSITASPQGRQRHDTCHADDYDALIVRSNGEHEPKSCW